MSIPIPSTSPLWPWLSGIAAAFVAWGTLHTWGKIRLLRAERAWHGGHPLREVLAALEGTGAFRGELGFRLGILEAQALSALGQQPAAWKRAEAAALARLPFGTRTLARFALWLAGRRPVSALRPWERRFLHRLPSCPRLDYAHALRLLAPGPAHSEAEAWNLLVQAVPLAATDPLLLEALMRTALARIQASREFPVSLGPQDWSPQVPYVFEESLRLLLHQHGNPRSAWGRTPPAEHLLGEGRSLEALVLARSVPFAQRTEPLCMVEVAALRILGRFHEAWTALTGALEAHPASFRLWIERFQVSMARRDLASARESLAMARRLQPPGDPGEEWHLRAAEFAHWAEQDSEAAWAHLEALPPALREAQPRLLAEVHVALGHFEEARRRISGLLARAPEPGLLMLRARCLAGLEAWESLLHDLADAPPDLQAQAEFWHLRGIARANLGDLPEARADLEIAARLAPKDLEILLDAGHACLDLGDPAGAETHGRRALQVQAISAEALLQVAEARRAQQDPEGARRFLRECLLHHPENAEAQAFLAELEAN